MTVDEILADTLGALDLPEGAIPISIMILAEYAEPGSNTQPSARRLATVGDDDLPPWTLIGMLRFAERRILNIANEFDDDENE